MRAIRLHETGGPEKLRLEDVPLPSPGAGEVRIRVAAAGINFIDTYQRSGLYPVPLPFCPGTEVAGEISAVGVGVTDFAEGDRVVTVRAVGGYADEVLAAAAHVIAIPSGVALSQAAALLLQGLTAHYLACDTFPLKPGHAVLIHAAAGGVGLLLTQIAKRRGARILAVVGSAAKVALAKAAGAEAVVVASEGDIVAAVREFTGGRGVDVVYDSVGRDTWSASVDSLRPLGLLVSFGNASGPVPAIAPLVLMQKGSLYLTRPTLAHYTATREDLLARAGDLFAWVLDGSLLVRIGATFALAEAADAHRALEGRGTTGKVLLVG